ncbi:Alginate lyase [Acinetobacter marinus]|uniref:Alginate lyase n=1 Tax=Acinetobacter marinus TaxID=281375 RepID=A0A1G6L0P4_9GAMM|nr:alginate lyase family protein [Acinetobacter marinus]SDC36753.1 Alginate lyase [Acinetobacter marinus]
MFRMIFLILVLNFVIVNASYGKNLCYFVDEDAIKVIVSRAEKEKKSSPNPLKTIDVGGLPNTLKYKEGTKALKDMRKMHDFAIAYKYTNDKRYLNLTKKFLFAWIDTYEPSYIPIYEQHMMRMVDSYGIIKGELSNKENSKVDKFLKDWAKVYIDKINSAPKDGWWISNWQSYRVKIISMIGFVTDDDGIIDSSRTIFKDQIFYNINSQGETVDFKERDAIHYVVFDLMPLVDVAILAKKNGEDWFNWVSPNGGSLKKAVDWVVPYATGDLTHQEFVHSKVKFDRIRADYYKSQGNVMFSGVYDPRKASNLFFKAAYFDSGYKKIIKKYSKSDISSYDLSLCWH